MRATDVSRDQFAGVPDVLAARSVTLRPVAPADYPMLHEIAHRPRVNATWVTRGRQIPLEEFPRLLWDGNVCAFTIASRATGAPLGYVGITNHDERTGTAYLSVFVDDSLPPASPAAGEGVALALAHAFAALGMRKVYAESTSASLPLMGSPAFAALPVSEEGRLKDHFPSAGGCLDSVVLAVYRDDFERSYARLLGLRDLPRSIPAEAPDESSAFRAVVDAIVAVTGRSTDPDGGWLLSEEIGLDSLSILEVVCNVEERLDRNASDQGVLSVRTVRDLVDLFTADGEIWLYCRCRGSVRVCTPLALYCPSCRETAARSERRACQQGTQGGVWVLS